jgi:hypothetical protein
MHARHAFELAPVADMVAAPRLRFALSDHGLTAREAHAVETGRRDAFRLGWDASLPRSAFRRRLAALFTRLTGIESARPFADERLELLRLFACMMRRDDRRSGDTAERLLLLGVTPAALHQAIARALA